MPRILIIEPYEAIRTLVEAALRHAGHDILAVDDGDAGLEAMRREQFACVVVGSPVSIASAQDPRLFLEYVERTSTGPLPPIVVMTTYVESARLLALTDRLNVCAVFAKPFMPREFIEVIDACVAGRALPRRWFGIPDVPRVS